MSTTKYMPMAGQEHLDLYTRYPTHFRDRSRTLGPTHPLPHTFPWQVKNTWTYTPAIPHISVAGQEHLDLHTRYPTHFRGRSRTLGPIHPLPHTFPWQVKNTWTYTPTTPHISVAGQEHVDLHTRYPTHFRGRSRTHGPTHPLPHTFPWQVKNTWTYRPATPHISVAGQEHMDLHIRYPIHLHGKVLNYWCAATISHLLFILLERYF
jgi:hypothetical protein